MQCEGIVAEVTRPTHSEIVELHDRPQRSGEPWESKYEKVIHTETIPEHRCEAPATTLARSMREIVTGEVEREDGSTVQMLAWERTEDRVYCAACFVPGQMVHLDGSVSSHPAMALDEVYS